MTHRQRTRLVRRVATALALLPAVLLATAAGPAWATAPDTWESPPSVSPLHVLLVLAVIPVGLFVLITLLVYLPSMSRSQNYQPGQAWVHEAEWFGGPRGGVDALPTDADSATPAISSTSGGASGRW